MHRTMAANADVYFTINENRAGGDGPKAVVLRRMIKDHDLADRVTLLGPVAAAEVPAAAK